MDANKLKEWRRRLGVTQSEVAEALSVSNATVTSWEIGRRKMKPPTARLLELLFQNALKGNGLSIVDF